MHSFGKTMWDLHYLLLNIFPFFFCLFELRAMDLFEWKKAKNKKKKKNICIYYCDLVKDKEPKQKQNNNIARAMNLPNWNFLFFFFGVWFFLFLISNARIHKKWTVQHEKSSWWWNECSVKACDGTENVMVTANANYTLTISHTSYSHIKHSDVHAIREHINGRRN